MLGSGEITIGVERTSRIGPMCVFKLYRCLHPERIVRSIEIPRNQQFVRLLDINACVNRTTGKVNKPLKYFSVREHEYCEALNYLISIDPKSINLSTILTYVRRRMGGVSLINKELLAPWELPLRHVYKFCIIILLQALVISGEAETIKQNIGVGSVSERFKAMLRMGLRIIFFPIAILIDWIMKGHLQDQLVLYAETSAHNGPF